MDVFKELTGVDLMDMQEKELKRKDQQAENLKQKKEEAAKAKEEAEKKAAFDAEAALPEEERTAL